jgi:tRNA nucleotidyltransferase (CCA-adding enzyme)
MRETGLLAVVLPALAATPPAALDHATEVLRRVPEDEVLRFAALLHGLCPEDAEAALVTLRRPRRVSEGVAALLRAHACRAAGPPTALPSSPVELRRWLSRVGLDRAGAVVALAAADADALPGEAALAARAEAKGLADAVAALEAAPPPLSTRDLALDGRAVMAALGAGPGPHVGEALRHLLERVLEDPSRNEPAALEEELRAWWAARPRRL